MQLPKHTHGCEDVTVVILLVRNMLGFMGLFSPFLFLPQKNERKCCHWEIEGTSWTITMCSSLCFKENSQMYTFFIFKIKMQEWQCPEYTVDALWNHICKNIFLAFIW